jgi:hypothetical protein
MCGDGAGHFRIIGDDLHVIALRIDRRDGVQLLRRDAHRVNLVPIATTGEIPRLGNRADGDRPMIWRGQRRNRQAFRCFHMRAQLQARMPRHGFRHARQVALQNAEFQH